MGGLILVAVFAVIIVLCVMADKNANKKFMAKYEAEHQVKDSLGDFTITTNDELIYNLPSGTLAGFKMWRLSDIGSIVFSRIKGTGLQFSVCDHDGKAMKGEYLTPSKKPLKEKAYASFPVKLGQSKEEIAEFITRNAPHITIS